MGCPASNSVRCGPPAVRVVDSKWTAGQKISKFQILDEDSGQGPIFFSVRLTTKETGKEQVVRYVVVGLDPLWVIRQEDFEMLAHWEHPMKKPDRP